MFHSYSPAQKKVLPPSTCSMSSVFTPRAWSTAYSLVAEVVADRADHAHVA